MVKNSAITLNIVGLLFLDAPSDLPSALVDNVIDFVHDVSKVVTAASPVGINLLIDKSLFFKRL